MAYTRINMPWLYDRASGDIIGIKDEDGGEMYFQSSGQSAPGGGSGPVTNITNVTVINQAKPGSAYLQWLQGLQYADEGKPAFGAIRWNDAPATRKGDDDYYKIEPQSAHMAMYYALEVAPDHFGVMTRRWLNWWMGNVSVTTKTTLIHYANKNGSVCTSALSDADPAVPTDGEDATDRNAALFLLLLARYLSLFGPDGLIEDWPRKAQIVYDGLAALRDADDLVWAKAGASVKTLAGNVEVWAGLGAAVVIFQLLGDTQRGDAASAWRTSIEQATVQTYWQEAAGTWSHSKDSTGTVVNSDLSRPSPDALCQLWPSLFGMDTRGGYSAVSGKWTKWHSQAIDPGGAAHPQIAMAAAQSGDWGLAQAWLVAVAAKRREGNSFRLPFTCADAAACAWVARAPKPRSVQGGESEDAPDFRATFLSNLS